MPQNISLKDDIAKQASLLDFEKLDKLAKICVEVGLNVGKGQEVVLTAPLSAVPLVRLITKHAYEKGADLVTPFFADDILSLQRFYHARDESFDKVADWFSNAMATAFSRGAARLAISGDNPLLLSQENPERVSRLNRAASLAYKSALEKISQFMINWSIVSYPHLDWAKLVFPHLEEKEAFRALGNAIFSASRVDNDDPLLAWREHNHDLHQRAAWLNDQNFKSLHFKSENTDLIVGLAKDHLWSGGASAAQNGIVCNPNIPTEEVFTTPSAYHVEGYVRSTKPLSHQGTLIEDIRVRFEKGRIIEASAEKGNEVLQKILKIDEGASRLGEVALVPHSSPISRSGLLFYNTLFDENASCHIALGQSYSKCLKGGAKLSQDEISEKGGNHSLIHIDWMIGSKTMNIDGLHENGDLVPIFRNGEWAS